MSGEWQRVDISGCAERVSDVVQPGLVAPTTPYIGLEHIVEAGLYLNGHSYAENATSSKSRFKKGDILFGKLRPYFRKVVRPAFDGVCSTDVWVVRAKHGVDQGYLFYLMASEEFIAKATEGSTGTRMPRADWDYLSTHAVHLPPLPEQRRIAKILGDLDDKIELNRKMNETLEQMARALFKSWFIDFDPVRAKMDGRMPEGMDADTAALFPSRLVESELGLVPEGWEVKALGDVLVPRIERVGFQEVDEYQCSNNGVVPRAGKYKKALSVSNERNLVIHRGDFVFGLSRQVLNFGVMQEHIGCVSPAYKVLRVKASLIDPFLLYRHMRARHDYYYGLVSASSREGQAVSMGSFQHIVTFIPTRSIQHAWIRFITQIESLKQQFNSQSRTLASLRDTLLPKLMRGEII
jgi:type I restriction enzyme S subunit